MKKYKSKRIMTYLPELFELVSDRDRFNFFLRPRSDHIKLSHCDLSLSLRKRVMDIVGVLYQ